MMNSTTILRKMSLRRAIWRARMAAKALRDHTELKPAEKHATELLRVSVRQQAQARPLEGFGDGFYAVQSEWRSQVLKRDPQVLCARSMIELQAAIKSDDNCDVLATREVGLSSENLRDLDLTECIGRSIFVES